MSNWQPIAYRDFHDIPRWIYTSDGQRAFVLDCPFDEAIDDYPGRGRVREGEFTVYAAPVLPIPDSQMEHWPRPETQDLQQLGRVFVARNHLDSTHRALLDWDVLAELLPPR
jgi:hypothetical protein